MTSSPGNCQRKTDSLTKTFDFEFKLSLNCLNFLPSITFVAIFASGIPIDLLMNGTVLLALGLT